MALASSASAGSRLPSFTDQYDDYIRDAVRKFWPDYPDWLDWKAQLYQESKLNSAAVSSVGAAGLAQFMPATWASISRQLGFAGVSPHEARYAIQGGAYYMAQLRAGWYSKRTLDDRQRLAQASYNTGFGNVLKAQKLCGGARLWEDINPCLPRVTGSDARQTIDYVRLIAYWRSLL